VFNMSGWAWDYLKEQLEEGKARGKKLKKKHKKKIKGIFKKKEKEDA